MKKLLVLIFAVSLLQLGIVSASHAAPPASGGKHHTVRYGETLFSIGRRYGVNPYHIADVNGLYNPNHIYAGQVLYIPSGSGYHDDYGSGHYGNCYNCGWQDRRRPVYHWDRDSGKDYQSRFGWDKCRSGCGSQRPHSKVVQGYGYDYAGYYYYSHYPNYQRYSYTCGYYYNCY